MVKYARCLSSYDFMQKGKIYLFKGRGIHYWYFWNEDKTDQDFLTEDEFEWVDEATARAEAPHLFENPESKNDDETDKQIRAALKQAVKDDPSLLEEDHGTTWKGYPSETAYHQAMIEKQKAERFKVLGNTDVLIESWQRGYRK